MAWGLGYTIAAVGLCASTSYALYARNSKHKLERHLHRQTATSEPIAYILNNQVTHSRLLPTESRHVFSYPTLSFLLPLHALEKNQVDVGRGWLFGYGGILGRLTGLRPGPYVTHHAGRESKMGIKDKLVGVLRDHGTLASEETFEDAWLMTMPAILGYEGINPLTVYFCYKEGEFWTVILEIHNTFGESHIHICEVGKNQDLEPDRGFTHQWTFLREFHVSPFNNRSGFYTVSIQIPTHPPCAVESQKREDLSTLPPRPSVRVRLHEVASPDTPSSSDSDQRPGAVKLSAMLHVKQSTPLTSSSLLTSLARAPFLLFLSMPRILYQAWILHYRKRLDVWVRPDPIGDLDPDSSLSDDTISDNKTNVGQRPQGVGVKWQTATALERFAQRRMEQFLTWRCRDLGVTVKLIAGDPSVPNQVFPEDRLEDDKATRSHSSLTNDNQMGSTLVIHYRSLRFFTAVYMAPSAMHALLFGARCKAQRHRLFAVSNESLFLEVFSSAPPSPLDTSLLDNGSPHVTAHHEPASLDTPASRRLPTPTLSSAQKLRCRPLPSSLLAPSLPVPNIHPLDQRASLFISAIAVRCSLMLDSVEQWAFWLVGARVIPGDEPWKAWERAGEVAIQVGGI